MKCNAKKFFCLFLLSLIVALPTGSYADDTVGPFGFGVGTNTIFDVQRQLNSSACDFDNISAITDGFLFECNSKVFDMEGITGKVIFIFEKKPEGEMGNAKLELVNFTLNKHMYDSIVKSLSSKYKLVSQNKPFVGDASARFKKNNVNILVDSPHLSFEMTVTYSTDNFDNAHQQYKKKQREESAAKQKSQL